MEAMGVQQAHSLFGCDQLHELLVVRRQPRHRAKDKHPQRHAHRPNVRRVAVERRAWQHDTQTPRQGSDTRAAEAQAGVPVNASGGMKWYVPRVSLRVHSEPVKLQM